MDLKAVGWEGMDQINVTQDWDKQQAAMNKQGAFSFANMQGIS